MTGERLVTIAGVVCAGEKVGHQMTVGNTCVPDKRTDQDDLLSACFCVRRSPGGWWVFELGEFIMWS